MWFLAPTYKKRSHIRELEPLPEHFHVSRGEKKKKEKRGKTNFGGGGAEGEAEGRWGYL